MIIKKTSSEWNLYTEILSSGQIAYETDTYRFKIGNGISPWIGNVLTALPYATVIIETSTLLASENLRIALNVVVLESDTNKFKIGDGSNLWNVLPYQKIVTASRFNNLQSRINLILGNGAGDRGYGQGSGYGLAVSSYQVNSNTNVRANDINSVYADIVRARIHQIGTEPTEIKELVANLNVIAEETSNFVNNDTGIVIPSTDTQGSRKGIADYETLMNAIDLDRFLAHPSQMSLETRLSSVRTALWNGTIFHEFSVQFNNENHRRHFFNSGGNIRISARNTNALRPKSLDWDQILLNSGTISFNYTNTTTTGSGIGSNIGNYDLTTSYIPIYQKIGQGTVDILYTGNTYIVYAKEIDNSTISFKIEFNDVAGDGTTFDANIEGRLATTIQEYRASSSAVEVLPPVFLTTTALDTFGEPEPVYQLTTTKSTVKEGEPFTIVLNTFNVPNGSAVPYVISGGVTAADLGLTSLVGNFIINNNAASRLFTPTLDSLQNETTEEFILTLNNDVASIKVNILNEALPTYNLTANKSTVEEGETFSITLDTTKIPDGTLLPYTITGITANDISPALLRGNFVINNNTSSVTFTTINDNLLEGSETFRLELDNLQDNISVLITDAQNITYSLTTNKASVKEGESFIVTLNTTFLANGTQVPYVITGIGVGDITQPGLTGIFTINNNTASVTFNTVIDTQNNEGNETFNLKLVNNAANVSVVIEEVVLPTSETRTCIAIIDEASIGGFDPSSTILNSSWATFRQNWPNRPFYLLQPNILNSGGKKYTNPSVTVLKVPAAYTAETVVPNPKAFGPIEVNRDEGVISRASDWFTTCNLGNLPNGSKIALFIDTSGSMNTDTIRASLAIFRQKVAEKNMQVIEVFNNQENWILPFNTILDTTTSTTASTTSAPNSTYSLSGPSSIIQGQVGTYTVSTQNVPNGTRLYWRLLSGTEVSATNSTLLRTLNNPNAFGTSSNDLFGHSVAISGNRAIVGAYLEDDAGGDFSGKAYIFDVDTGALLRTLSNPNAFGTSSSDFFGYSVAISGNLAIVGAFNEGGNSTLNSAYGGGKAYVFDVATGALLRIFNNPTSPFNTVTGNRFGSSVGISGTKAIVGSYYERTGNTLTQGGQAYIFDIITGSLLHRLDKPNAFSTNFSDRFGDSVSISGNRAIVGASRKVTSAGIERGEAYIFDVTTGALLHTLNSSTNVFNSGINDRFGSPVAISGSRAIVGSATFTSTSSPLIQGGLAYIFDVATGALLRTLNNPNAGLLQLDTFGDSVSISGNRAIVGASQISAGGTGTGNAYIFDVSTGSLLHTLTNPNASTTSSNDLFGLSVSISGNRSIVGASREDEQLANDSGKAYIFNSDIGSVTINNNTGVFSVTTTQDSLYNDTNSLQLSSAILGNTVLNTIPLTVLNPNSTYSLGFNTTNPSFETFPDIIQAVVTTVNVPTGTTLYYTISGDAGSNDFESPMSGSFIIQSNGIGTFDINPIADGLTEGDEGFTVNIRVGSISGTIVATGSRIISDSLSPTYNLNSLAISGFEPTGFTVSVTTTNVPNATVLYLTIDGATTADFSAVQVSTIINNNAGTFPQIQMLADGLIEGDETYTASLRTGSFTGPVVDTLTITVRD